MKHSILNLRVKVILTVLQRKALLAQEEYGQQRCQTCWL
jgi:heme exporter protein D